MYPTEVFTCTLVIILCTVSDLQFHAGKQWDYVFDVDVEEGAPPRKLAMNKGDNPHQVAERFLIEENLPTTYKHQVCTIGRHRKALLPTHYIRNCSHQEHKELGALLTNLQMN